MAQRLVCCWKGKAIFKNESDFQAFRKRLAALTRRKEGWEVAWTDIQVLTLPKGAKFPK